MRRIHGYVLVKESNQGVPNLVVRAFDCETAVQELLNDRSRAVVPPLFMERLGTPIGSVLTDKDGAFHLTRVDLHFEGVESSSLLPAALPPRFCTRTLKPDVLSCRR